MSLLKDPRQSGGDNAEFRAEPAATHEPRLSRADMAISPAATQKLQALQLGTSTSEVKNTSALRDAVVIHGSGKLDTDPLLLLHKKHHRLLLHFSISALLVLFVITTLVMASPLNSGGHSVFDLWQTNSDTVASSRSINSSVISQDEATATAVTQDGFDPGANTGQFADVPGAPILGGGGLDRFFYGQCTYWANMHYHDLTGLWVPWLGNAAQWASGAIQSGWVVSGTPRVSSILVLQPFVQGAGGYGHVAVVERVNPDGSVLTSNWNWGGGWASTTYVTFTPGPGVSFVWAPGH
ncbi:MAG TPA: CHAP domain-containing protein [Ktedonobacteraceae bacterium]|nr:CHAP domain-containing protein [Ktedonobacteraceae bacterium]